jgi:hypothetical protein
VITLIAAIIVGMIDQTVLNTKISHVTAVVTSKIFAANSGLASIHEATLSIIGWITFMSFSITGNKASPILHAISEKEFFNSANLSAIVCAGSQNSSRAFLHSTKVALTNA